MTTGFYDMSVQDTDALLNKPFDLQTLKNAIDSVLSSDLSGSLQPDFDLEAGGVPVAGSD
jgi:hypothetical protein